MLFFVTIEGEMNSIRLPFMARKGECRECKIDEWTVCFFIPASWCRSLLPIEALIKVGEVVTNELLERTGFAIVSLLSIASIHLSSGNQVVGPIDYTPGFDDWRVEASRRVIE